MDSTDPSPAGGTSHLIISATLSVLLVVGVLTWRFETMTRQNNTDLYAVAHAEVSQGQSGDAASDLAKSLGIHSPTAIPSNAEEIAQIGTTTIGRLVTYYNTLSQNNEYTPEVGAQIAASIAPSVKADIPYTTYDASSITTKSDTSYSGMIAYRKALQGSFAPLQKNTTYELDLYDTYMKKHDAHLLVQLKSAAQNYHSAAEQTAKVIVPSDATSIQIGVLNALQEFGTTLDFMIDNINSPVTSLALLGSYNKAENDMTIAFSALNTYYASKRP